MDLANMKPHERSLTCKLLEAFIYARSLPEVASFTEEFLSRLVSADYMALCVSRAGQPSQYDWWVAKMPAEFFAVSPEFERRDFVRTAVSRRPGEVLLDSDMISRQELERSAMYRRSHDMGMPLKQVMSVLMPDEGQTGYSGFSAYRARYRPFTERERRILQQVAPLLARTIQKCRLFAQWELDGRLLESLSQDENAALLVVAPSSHEVIKRTEQASTLLAKWFSRDECGPSGLPREWAERLSVLAVKKDDATGELGTWWRHHDQEGESLRVTFREWSGQEGTRWTLTLKEVAHSIPLPAVWRSRLTERQAEVVSYVLHFWDQRTIAEELGCTVGTLKKHMQDIFDEMGVCSQKALISLALRS
ncbi:DNA-binding response regulator [Archangium violaceum]|uniref:helix-turn-helix transcriptional regulator n=1 Tax=Archangium violaceum TaxID=83451 RepID=UPI00195117D0|nr:DNA-binding response regulator [Archangium violaceum]QRO01427.1 DNA-binding response regulator [Archangium violaceum]